MKKILEFKTGAQKDEESQVSRRQERNLRIQEALDSIKAAVERDEVESIAVTYIWRNPAEDSQNVNAYYALHHDADKYQFLGALEMAKNDYLLSEFER